MAQAVSRLMPTFGSLKKPKSSISRLLFKLSYQLHFIPKRYRITSIVAIASILLAAAGYIGGRYVSKDSESLLPRSRAISRHNSYYVVSDSQAPRQITINYQGKKQTITIKPTKSLTFDAHRRLFIQPPPQHHHEGSKSSVDKHVLRQFAALWAIMVPRFSCNTSGLLAVHACFLILRTWLSLVVARLDGQIVRDLIAANKKQFGKGLALWFAIGVPASLTNSMIKYLEAKISISFRTRLIRYIHDIYLDSNLTYYKLENIDGRIQAADQYITSDLTRFCDAAARLYSNLGKPSVDFAIFSHQLYKNLGPLALVGIFSNYFATSWILKAAAPQFGRLAAMESKLEGEYRNAHSKLITNAEEIAFYDGTELERTILKRTYHRLVKHVHTILKIKVAYNILEDFILKYSWSALGYLFASMPVFLPNWSALEDNDIEMLQSLSPLEKDFRERNRTKQFITNKRLLLSLADAGGRLMYSIKDLAELAGYTFRVYSFISSLHRVHSDNYSSKLDFKRHPKVARTSYGAGDVRGTMQLGYDGIRFEKTAVAVPGLAKSFSNGDVLIKSLDIQIAPGQHLLITGPNGVGKSAIARVLAGLWPVFRGLVSKPLPEDISFLPQRPYLSLGTLRDQIIYPCSHAEMLSMGQTDEDLLEILDQVRLSYLPEREGGLDVEKQWKDVFSGGEKQRIMFARILFKRPRFAVIDEGTNAVSRDVEGILYETCQNIGITIITISHRPSLLRYHTAQLKLGTGIDGQGWKLEQIDTEKTRLSVEKEIESLQAQLSQVDSWKQRYAEITKQLNA